MKSRERQLHANFLKIFWIRALTSIRFLNIVFSIFYVHRGVELHQIFYLGMTWAIAHFLSEVPSSYLADLWGRKKTIVLGTLLNLGYWGIYFYAQTFEAFLVGTIIFAVSFSLFSGTDEALLFDSAKELGEEDKGKRIGKFYAANRLFRIFGPVLAVLIAKDLSEQQFQFLISVDIIGGALATLLALTLTEAKHKMDVSNMEAGIMHDAVRLFRRNTDVFRAMLSKTLLILSTLMVWHYFQEFYHSQGVSLLALGIGWSIFGLVGYISHSYLTHRISDEQVSPALNKLKFLNLALFLCTTLLYFTSLHPIWMFAAFVLTFMSINIQHPLYSRYLNKAFSSYNRSTSISLSNLLKGILDPIVSLISAYLIMKGMIYPYFLSIALVLIVLCLPLRNIFNKASHV